MNRQAFMTPKIDLGLWKRNDDEPQSGNFTYMYVEEIKEGLAIGRGRGSVISVWESVKETDFQLPMETIRKHYQKYNPNLE